MSPRKNTPDETEALSQLSHDPLTKNGARKGGVLALEEGYEDREPPAYPCKYLDVRGCTYITHAPDTSCFSCRKAGFY